MHIIYAVLKTIYGKNAFTYSMDKNLRKLEIYLFKIVNFIWPFAPKRLEPIKLMSPNHPQQPQPQSDDLRKPL